MVVDKGKGKEQETKRQELARDYGFDISMSDSAIGASSASHWEYKYKCKRIYKDFLKNMNSYINEEKELRKTLSKLNREKINNKKYSLYRSAGKDLFSTAKQIRKKLMESKLVTVSPLMEEFQGNTPWGLDAIIDEDLIRPQTAPSNSLEHINTQMQETTRPKTVANGNSHQLTEEGQQNQTFGYFRRKSEEMSEIRIPSRAKHEKVRFQPQPPVSKVEPVVEDSDSENDDSADGVVDPNTERTRARKITISPEVFAKLAKGTINVSLKNKDGKFIVKPITINYEVSDVDAVFMPKDLSKEKMALVRQKTSPNSGTVAADMKINNKIAIMKSLVGKDTKKTTVAEIMENSRYRKTRHFKIVKKLTAEEERRRESIVIGAFDKWKSNTGINRSKQSVVPIKAFDGKEVAMSCFGIRKNQEMTQNSSVYRTNDSTEPSYVGPKVLAARERRNSESRMVARPMSQSTDHSHDGLNVSHNRVSYSRQLREGTPVHDKAQTPYNRPSSVLSQRDGILMTGSDKQMTEMIRRLVEGKEGDHLDRPDSSLNYVDRKDKTVTLRLPKRAYTPSATSDSHSELSLSFDVPRKLQTPDATRRIVKDLMRKDKEYEENMATWKRRMISGRTTPFGKRRNSIIVS